MMETLRKKSLEIKAQIQDLNRNIRGLKEKRRELRMKIDKLQEQHEALSANIDDMRKDLENLKHRDEFLDIMPLMAKKIKVENARVKAEMEDKTKQLEILLEKDDTCKTRLKKLKQRRTMNWTNIYDMKKALAELEPQDKCLDDIMKTVLEEENQIHRQLLEENKMLKRTLRTLEKDVSLQAKKCRRGDSE